MKRNNAKRIFAITMLVLLAMGAIVLIVVGCIVFNYIFLEGKFFFDLSHLDLFHRNFIVGITGLIGTFFPIGVGSYLLVLLIGVENIIRFFDKIMS